MHAQRFRVVSSLLTLLVFFSLSGLARGASSKPTVVAVNAPNGVALQGYDPVAYFTSSKPTPGMDTYTYQWQGATYRFASAENQERFKAEPEKYLPQYGGYCAYAMSLNRIADINPDRWAIVDGKLYLNNNLFAYGLWAVDKSDNITAADRNWAVYPKTPESQDSSSSTMSNQ